jgi:hypothetical protein
MKTFLKSWVVQVLAMMLAASVAFAQDRVPFRQEELDQMLAPVALYPDPLLSQVLMASTYPLEVVQASRWSRANPGLEGEEAVRAAGEMDWDPSVKALAAFPQVLAMMDENIGWTERLGEAFLAQQAEVMDTVQGLRRRAEAAGNLRSTEQMRVARQGDLIYLEPPVPEIVYVPYYDPVVIYGSWWWPAFRPFFWAPPRAHYAVPAHRPAFLWGSRIVVSNTFFFARPDWQRRQVTIVRHQGVVNRATVVHRPEARPTWQHNTARRAAPVRNPEVRQRFEQSRAAATPAQQAVPSPAPAARQRQPEARGDTDRRAAVRVERRDNTDRRVDIRPRQREERREIPHPRARNVDTRPPVATHVARPAVAAPAPRVETRTAPRNFTAASAARPQPVARAPNQAPRATRNHEPGDRGARVRRD